MSTPTLHIVKDLLHTLENGRDGFKEASDAVKDPALKARFATLSSNRQRMIDELVSYSEASYEDASPTVAGAIHRGWINLKGALTSGDDHAILAECERGEDHAVSEFRLALDDTALVGDERSAVQSVFQRVLSAHNEVRALRDATAAA